MGLNDQKEIFKNSTEFFLKLSDVPQVHQASELSLTWEGKAREKGPLQGFRRNASW